MAGKYAPQGFFPTGSLGSAPVPSVGWWRFAASEESGHYLAAMGDTSPDAESVRIAAVRRVTPIDRLRQALDLSDVMRRLAIARLRQTHPDHSDRQLASLLRQGDGPLGQ